MFLITQTKKLVLVLANFLLVIKTSKKVKYQQLKRILYIQYLDKFKKNHIKVQALIDSSIEVNIITPAYIAILEKYICPIAIEAQKKYESILLTYSMILAKF